MRAIGVDYVDYLELRQGIGSVHRPVLISLAVAIGFALASGCGGAEVAEPAEAPPIPAAAAAPEPEAASPTQEPATTPRAEPVVAAAGATPSIVPTSPPSPIPTAAAVPTATPTPAPTPSPTPTPGPAFTVVIGEGSEARYRVKEQLAGRNLPNDAVGKTPEVTGAIKFTANGEVLTAGSVIAVDVSTLESDDGRRDRYIRRNSLESNRFPIALFKIERTPGLPWPLPSSGEAAFQLEGEMIVHSVTKPLTWEVTARFDGPGLTAQATTNFKFGYFNMAVPSAFIVLSVEDNVKLELDIVASIKTGG